jgi:curved DNA-binding protein CbpA
VERIQDRPSERQALTHYDDLGLPPAASGEEIREAYLTLVRLLHPDLQREPALKRYTQNQMQRVSRAYAVLSDPERRRRYDASLGSNGAQDSVEPAAIRRSVGRWRARALITIGWLICAFAGVVGIGWYFSQPAHEWAEPVQPAAVSSAPATNIRPGPPSRPAPPAAGAADTSDLDSLRSELASAKTARDRALDQTVLQAKELDFLSNRILSHAASNHFSGVWVLPSSKIPPVSSAFTPESVDLIMAERQSVLQGRYRARYPSMGLPEPPMVHFYFEGTSHGDTANAAWTGEGGSKGEIQLKLTSANTLQLVWSVTEQGSQTGPATGTVALVRKREP